MNIQKSLKTVQVLHQKGNFRAMERRCREILRKQSRNYDAIKLLGGALGSQGKFEGAIEYFQKALDIKQDATVYNYLGMSYFETGDLDNAANAFTKSTHLDDTQAEVFNNLGAAQIKLKNYALAEEAYDKAISLNPTIRQMYMNLAACKKKTGQLGDAVQLYLKANELDPNSPEVYVRLYQCLALNHVTDDAVYVAEKGLKVAPPVSPERLELLIGLGIHNWLNGRSDVVSQVIDDSTFIHSKELKTYKYLKNLGAFRRCLTALLELRNKCQDVYNGDADEPIHFVAESHCLPPSGTIITYRNENYRVISSLIQGCKAYHLGRKEDNEFKESLAVLLKAIPEKSKVIIGMGEIDCRKDEGFLKTHLEEGGDYELSIPEVVRDYLDYVKKCALDFDHEILIYGVPPMSANRRETTEPEKVVLLDQIIKLFNKALSEVCEKYGWQFLDVFSFALNSDENLHIDLYHLHPKVLRCLFREISNERE